MDYSFIRFEDSLDKARQIKNSPMSLIQLNESIQLLPCERYLQISNTKNGIDFDGDYQALLINCDEKVMADITSNFFIYEFVDKFGVNQIAFEIYKIGLDFYKQPLRIKLIHTSGTDIYYSNDFYLTNYQKEKTTRFEYRNNSYFQGISYDRLDFYQSIRVQLWFSSLENQTETTDYFQISTNNTISARPLIKQLEKYKGDFINNFVYERVNNVLLSDIIYIDGVRMTNKTVLEAGEFIGDTNYYKSTFSCFKDYSDIYNSMPFIADELNVIEKSPIDYYTLLSLPNEISVLFNKNITLNNGNVSIYNSDTNVLIASFNGSQLVVVGNLLTIDITGIIITNGNYKIVIDSGLIGVNCERLGLIEWEFIINDGFYDKAFYDTNNYA